MSEGWFTVGGGHCEMLVANSETADRTTYFVSAHNDNSVWEGDYTFCTTRRAFTIHGDQSCADRGYDLGHFNRVDSPSGNAKTNLTDGSTLIDEG